ncbi:MAG: hypothetical protein ACKOXK_08810 [Chakrabartia sp.]
MSLKLYERLTGLLAFDGCLGVYFLLMDDRRFRVLNTVERLHHLRGRTVEVSGPRVAYNILSVDRIAKA